MWKMKLKSLLAPPSITTEHFLKLLWTCISLNYLPSATQAVFSHLFILPVPSLTEDEVAGISFIPLLSSLGPHHTCTLVFSLQTWTLRDLVTAPGRHPPPPASSTSILRTAVELPSKAVGISPSQDSNLTFTFIHSCYQWPSEILLYWFSGLN